MILIAKFCTRNLLCEMVLDSPRLVNRIENKLIECFAIRNGIVQELGAADAVFPVVGGFRNLVLFPVQFKPDRTCFFTRLKDHGYPYRLARHG